MQHSFHSTAILAGILVLSSTTAFAADPAVKCEAGKLKEAGKYANCRMKADSKGVKKGEAPDYTKCLSKFGDKWSKTETKAGGACPSNGDEVAVEAAITTCMGDIAAGLTPCGAAGGVEVNSGDCWFLGALGANCTDTCAAAGLVYDDATATYAGSSGLDGNCGIVLEALGAPAGAVNAFACIAAIDCYYGDGARNRCTNAGGEGNSYLNGERACACMPAP